MKRILIIILVIAVLVAVGGGVYYWQNQNRTTTATTARVQTATVQRGNLLATVNAAGNVSAPKQTALNFQTSGKVSLVNVQVGDRVKKDQLLMQVDPTDLQFALRNAQLTLANAQTSYDATKADNAQNPNRKAIAKATLDKAKVTVEQAQLAYNKVAWRPDVGMTSEASTLQQATMDYQTALANYNVSVASITDTSLNTAQSQIDIAKITVEQAQRDIEKTKIIAPYDGVVSTVGYNVGDSSGTAVAVTLVDPSRLEVKVTVAEVDITKIKAGATAQMTLDALTGKTYNAQVSTIGPVGTVTSGVVNYPVVLSVTDADGAIKPGMTANLAVVVDSRQNVLLIPLRAVRTQGNQRIVNLVSGDKTTPTPVRIGLTNDTSAEILSGVQEGDVVAINQTTTNQPGGPGGGGFGIPFIVR